jgi:murein DD-endopeptidase MepM/ murein hydrolase activator NlpD
VQHVVQPGQTLWRVARAYGLTPEILARANGIEDPTQIEAGQTIFIPGATTVLEVPPYRPPAEAEVPTRTAGRSSYSSDWAWPVPSGEILSYYGAPRRGHRHAGVDIGGAHGAKVVASRGGKVRYSGSGMRGYGKTVIIDHGDRYSSLYAHNSKLLVRVGERVKPGQTIARVGSSGNASGNHCHFEIRRDDRAVDPLLYLVPPLGGRR